MTCETVSHSFIWIDIAKYCLIQPDIVKYYPILTDIVSRLLRVVSSVLYLLGHQPDMQSSQEEGSATHRVADAEGCQEDSTSRDAMIIKLRVIFIQQINKHPLLNS